jgi:uncharacterized membrane protein
MMVPSNRFVRNTAISAVVGFAIISLIIGLIMQAPQRALLLIVSIAIGAGTIGALIGLLILRMIYAQFRSDGEKLKVGKNARDNLVEAMYIEYELNTDDALAFHLYNYEHSPQLGHARKLVRRGLLFAVAVELLAAAVIAVALGKGYLLFVLVLCAFALLTFLYYVVSPSLMRKGLRGTVARAYSQGKNKLTGKHKLSITPDGVTDIADIGETTTRWDAIEWLASTDQYLFMMVRGSGPHIVPKRSFADEAEFRQFVEASKVHHQAAMEASNPGSLKSKEE